MSTGLSLLVHGLSKTGKSYLGDSTPGPRLILDAESGSRYTPSRKKEWDPVRENPPVPDGTWDTAIVFVRDYQTILQAYEWLNSGQHPFKSVVIDSISEVQQKCVDALVGVDPMRQQDWGTLLRKLSDLIRRFRDLVTHPTNRLSAVILIAMTKELDTGRYVPYVQGGLATTLPYFLDVVAYLQTVKDESGVFRRFLMLQPDSAYMAGERVGGVFGPYLEIYNEKYDTVTRMLDILEKAEADKGRETP